MTVTVTPAGALSLKVTTPLRARRGAPTRTGAAAGADGALGVAGEADGVVAAVQPAIVTGELPVAVSPVWLVNAAVTSYVPHFDGVFSNAVAPSSFSVNDVVRKFGRLSKTVWMLASGCGVAVPGSFIGPTGVSGKRMIRIWASAFVGEGPP